MAKDSTYARNHMDNALEKLKVSLLQLATLTEEQLKKAVLALRNRDAKLAREIIRGDEAIDQMEVDIEESCLQILALHQPVANDLRFVIAVLKINNDLERIADYATGISRRVIDLSKVQLPVEPIDFSEAAQQVIAMLRMCLDSFIQQDIELATKVLEADDELDEFHNGNYPIIKKAVIDHPDHAMDLMRLVTVSRYFERIGDMATNIAEDVIYMVSGEIVRHQPISQESLMAN